MPVPFSQSSILIEAPRAADADRAQTSLVEANRLLTMAEELAHVGHWQFDQITGQGYFSDEARRITGLDLGGPPPTREAVLAAYHVEDRERVTTLLAEHVATGTRFEYSARVVRPDGNVRAVLVRGRCDRDLNVGSVVTFGTVLDVTENRRTEQQLRDTSELLTTTLDTMDQGLMMVDGHGHVVVANRRAAELLDLEPAFLAGRPHYTEVRRMQADAGEYASAEPAYQAWVRSTNLAADAPVYERVRPNGTVLEVRSVPLADGGVLRTYTDVTARREAETRLREKTALLDATLENMDQGLMMIDVDGIVQVCNARACELLDLPVAMLQAQTSFASIVASQLRANEFAASGDAGPAAAFIEDWLASGSLPFAQVYERERPNGTVLEVRTVPLPNGGVVRTYTDITERRRAETALHAKTALLDVTLENMDQGLMMVDAGGVVQVCNQRAIHLLDLPDGMMRAQPTFEAVRRYQLGQRDFVRSDDRLRDWVAAGGLETEVHAYERERPNGTVLEIRTVPLADGSAVRTYTDITQRKAAEARIAHMARHDALTDLPNRTLFRERLEHRLAKLRPQGGSCAVLCLDLDRFKVVNDTLGHLAGDALLREVARRLRAAVRKGDTVARLGGDEFAVLVASAKSQEAVRRLAASLIRAVQAPVILGGQPVEVGLSIGVAFALEHGVDVETVVKCADVALYRAKADGRGTFCVFELGMDEQATERRELEHDLRRAIASGDLALHYQPQVRSATGETVGFEALVRWTHPTRGPISPAIFVALAEETGLIAPLGEWVLRTACLEAAHWSTPLKIAVNLSPRQFAQIDLPERVLAILTETGLSPTRLELEITETVIINDIARALAILRRLKGLGIRISMDDFGTGYSSLATLQAFPFDKIKIDRAFVGRMDESPQAAAIVRAVLGLGRSLGMGVVAEGVETEEQLRFLADAACDEVQGYLTGRPQPVAAFAEILGGVPIKKSAKAAA